MVVEVGILTVSTQCSKGAANDTSGPALEALLCQEDKQQWRICERKIVPDDKQQISAIVSAWSLRCRLIIVSGGTGISPSDVTIEAIEPLFTKRLPALATAMVVGSLTITPFAALSQVAAGVIGQTVVLAVPGSKKGSVENVQQVLKVLPHAVDTAAATEGTRHLHAPSGKVKSKVACNCSRPEDQEDQNIGVHGLSNDLGISVSRRARRSPYPMIPVAKALQLVLDHVKLLPIKRLLLNQISYGQILAEDVIAQENVPGYPASIMDGYAMIAADGPGVFAVRSALTAGSANLEGSEMLKSGEVVRVATGAPIPPGADAVVMVEDTELVTSDANGEEQQVRILASKEPIVQGQNIRPIGHDLRAETVVLRAGTQISEIGGEIGTMAISGNKEFAVYAMPRIAVMSTGDEVVDVLNTSQPHSSLAYGCIRDSNRPALLAALHALGCQTMDLGVVRDDPDLLSHTIRSSLQSCDGLISTGGVSMGERDWLKPVVEQRLGGTIHFGRVAMKPSKPTTFATVPSQSDSRDRFVFALPGNPVSALVAFHMFVAPALRMISGYLIDNTVADVTSKLRPSVQAEFIDQSVQLDRVRPEYIRGVLAWDHERKVWVVSMTDHKQQSSRIASMQSANALISLPIGTNERPSITTGETVTVIVIGTPLI
ncbi:hypothetical protein IWW36_000596 [Coemansia brasiliensis]|uniref:molybdopterin adenylyltransferase n=1 Tax=Coemansia brasiliensis TaxID=2650707 RepID=A0A9W8IDB0_9FUNG|nr:hypothetical protein IWW36_000596 [Coemansia brasiliensis]